MKTFPAVAAAFLATLICSGPVAAADSPQPTPKATAHVEGYRSARFGMTEEEVRGAIANDFRLTGTEVKETTNPLQATRALFFTLSKLEPGPGPAIVSYIFGATSHRLVHVNVSWTLDNPNPAGRERVAIAGAALTEYFTHTPAPFKTETTGATFASNGLIMFSGLDDQGAAVEVAAAGISFTRTDPKTGVKTPSPPPLGPARLRVSYIANVLQPDIHQIKHGLF